MDTEPTPPRKRYIEIREEQEAARRAAREDAARQAAQEQASRRAEREQAAAQRGFRFRLWRFGGRVSRAASVLTALATVRARSAELDADPQAQARAEQRALMRVYAWGLLVLLAIATTADLMLLLPNNAYATAQTFSAAFGAPASGWATALAFGVLEFSLLGLLVAAKKLSETREHAAARGRAETRHEYRSATWRLWGAWLARGAYIVLISSAFWVTIGAEQSKARMEAMQAREAAAITVATAGGLSLEGNAGSAPEPVAASPEEGGPEVSPIVAVCIILWGLHIAILFLPPGKFSRRSIGELRRAEVERMQARFENLRIAVLLELNAWLDSARQDAALLDAMVNRTPRFVIDEVESFLRDRAGLPANPPPRPPEEPGATSAAPVEPGPQPITPDAEQSLPVLLAEIDDTDLHEGVL